MLFGNKVNVNKTIIPIFASVIILVVVATIATVSSFPNETFYTYAYSQEKLTDRETLKVKLTTMPEDPKAGEDTKINIEFIDSESNRIQKNVDYKVTIEDDDGNPIHVSNRQTHTVSGSVFIDVILEDGTNTITINISKILFESIPVETVTFDVTIENPNEDNSITTTTEEEKRSSLSSNSSIIPPQFKNHAALWTEGQISDDSFVQSIEYLIKEKVISISSSHTAFDSKDIMTREIPQWVKNSVNWWIQGLISDEVFLQNIEYLIENEIIIVN